MAVMESASQRPFSAPVGRPLSGAGRHTRSAATQRISCRRASGRASSYSGVAEPLEKQGAAGHVIPQEPHTAFPVREAQDLNLDRSRGMRLSLPGLDGNRIYIDCP